MIYGVICRQINSKLYNECIEVYEVERGKKTKRKVNDDWKESYIVNFAFELLEKRLVDMDKKDLERDLRVLFSERVFIRNWIDSFYYNFKRFLVFYINIYYLFIVYNSFYWCCWIDIFVKG